MTYRAMNRIAGALCAAIVVGSLAMAGQVQPGPSGGEPPAALASFSTAITR